MRKALIGILCLLVSSLSAEILRDVEYSLPQEAQNWKIANKIENETGATIIYIPEDSDNETISQYFGVNTNNFKFTGNEVDTIKESLIPFFPNMDLEVKTLDKNKDGLLYEWSAKENNEERVHGWGRVLVKPNGTAILNFQTEEVENLSNTSAAWLPVLKSAKIKIDQ